MQQLKRSAWVVLAGAIVLWPAVLWAHARLTRSEPAAKSEVTAAPAMIRLWFSEAPEVSLSRITLSDSSGASVPLGPVVAADSSKLGLAARVQGTLRPGLYTVSWRIAGDDGHPVSGSYTYRVLDDGSARLDTARVSPVPTTPAPEPSATEPSAEALTYVATRFASFVALLLLIGSVGFKFAVMDRAAALGTDARLEAHARLARASAAAAAILLVAAAARLQLQRELVSDPSHLVHLRNLASHTGWGRAWLLQVCAALAFVGAAWLGRRGSSPAWAAAGLAAVALALSASLGGHAGAATSGRAVSVVADAFHVLGAAGWLGGIACLLVVGLPASSHGQDGRWQGVASMVTAFSPLAIACAGVVVVTGLFSAWLRLGALAPLWTTAYGRVLLLKVALLLGVAAIGAYNWLRVKPALGTAEATATLKKVSTAELAMGLAVIAATAVLVALPTPLDPSP